MVEIYPPRGSLGCLLMGCDRSRHTDRRSCPPPLVTGDATMPATRLRIFLSSVQGEFAQVRRDLKAFLLGDAVLRRFIADVFLFEDLPARDQRTDAAYLEQVERCDVYLGLFGYEYGSQDDAGVSATEREYDHATKRRKTRLVFVWGSEEKRRAPGMRALIAKASAQVIRRRVENASALTTEVYTSLVDLLDRRGALRIPPFDTSACDRATLADVSRKRIDWFLTTARSERNFSLKQRTSTEALLAHLNLLDGDRPTNAALLLFGKDPQRFYRSAETKCVRVHGTRYERPFAVQHNYGGDLFAQANQATDFVLGKIDRSIGERSESPIAPRRYEVPPDAIAEAIVNAIVHRDYHSNASVEVHLFADRLEVWNPGALPGTLTLEDLHTDHASIPQNPLLAESLYLTGYIEKLGSGTQKILALCKAAGLPEPSFEQRSGSFVLTLWRDWLTPIAIERLALNDRQRAAIAHLKTHGRLSNPEYQRLTGAIKKTATRDLQDLKDKGVLTQVGVRGPGVHYVFARGRQNGDE